MRRAVATAISTASTVVAAAITFLLIAVNSSGLAQPQDSLDATSPCSQVLVSGSQPLSNLPARVQTAIKKAVGPGVQGIIHDPGMGMSDTNPETVPLNAIEIARPSKSSVLYFVTWGDSSFGVNAFNWLVEVRPDGAVSLLSPGAQKLSGGFGVGVLSPDMNGYPDVVIASKGFKEGGGAEAEEICLRKTGNHYDQMACPAMCHRNLNAR
jgi:hypothetical protein